MIMKKAEGEEKDEQDDYDGDDDDTDAVDVDVDDIKKAVAIAAVEEDVACVRYGQTGTVILTHHF